LFEDKNLLITGGTGSLGQALTKRLLEYDVKTIRILSRNESKQVEMQSKFDDPRLRFLVGDIRDQTRLLRATEGVDLVFHAAALKHVPLIESNPSEAIKTNVLGSENLIIACTKNKVKKVVGIGTDKAVSPLNTYGATKLLMEKLFTNAVNEYSADEYDTRFLALRYGNVVASSGSVIPLFIDQLKNKEKLTITDPNMTRFTITMNQAIDFILDSTSQSVRSEVFVPKLQSYKIIDLVQALEELLGEGKHELINARPGEKSHELLINKYEIKFTKDLGDKFVILNPQIFSDSNKAHTEVLETYCDFPDASFEEEYSSDKSPLLSVPELKMILKNYI
jgi:UDP-N-acetylglucosamine 4,6-dehydratase/5-epimerase